MLAWQKLINDFANDWRTTETTANDDFKAQVASVILLQMQANIMHLRRGAVMFSTDDRNLEFTRQKGKFRLKG